MNRASLMLAALEDGDWFSRRDLFNHAGAFYLTNNAASELRALGHNVEQRRFEGNYEYRLCAEGAFTDPPEAEVDGAAAVSSTPSVQLALETA